PEALDALLQECRRDNATLGRLLLARGLLRQKELECLEGLAEGQVQRHGNDAGKTLATLRTLGAGRSPSGSPTPPDPLAPAAPAVAAEAPPGTPGTVATLSPPAAGPQDPSLAKLPAAEPTAPSAGAGQAGASRYRVVRPHARGGLGEVFVALDAELN